MSQTPFDQLYPKDGYQVVARELGSMEISLYVGLWADGELLRQNDAGMQNLAEVWMRRAPSAQDYAERSRAQQLLEGVVNYFNAGGSWDELRGLLTSIKPVVTGGLTFEGYHLFDCYTDTEGHYTVVYVQDGTDKVVRWVRESFIDTDLTLADLQREEEEDEADDDGDPEIHRLGELPGGSDFAAEDEDADGDPDDLSGSDFEG